MFKLGGWSIALAMLALPLFALVVHSRSAAPPEIYVERIEGIHYAVPRNALHSHTWRHGMRRTRECAPPCEVAFDERVSAVHLRFKWSQLNPKAGVYDFDALGAIIDEVSNAGKYATLAVMSGKYTPEWVIQRSGAIDVPVRRHGAQDGSSPYAPRPWAPAFLDAYADLFDALSDFLRRTPRRYEAVALVKNAAVSIHSAEVRLLPLEAYAKKPIHDRVKRNLRARLCEAWLRAGYAEKKVVSAMRTASDRISDAFPDKLIGMAFVAGSNRFPTIRDGRCRPEARNRTLGTIIKTMVRDYRGAAVINSTVLHAGGGAPRILDWVKRNGGRVGFQINRQKAGCRQGKGPSCDPAAIRRALEAGLSKDALFIEVHDGNIHRHRKLLARWNALMRSR